MDRIRVELKKDSTGRLRRYWYGIHESNGKRRVVTLNRLRGTPPVSLSSSDLGDPAFEASREEARREAAKVFAGDRDEAEQVHLLRSFYRARYGNRQKPVALASLADHWATMPRKRKVGTFHGENMERALGRFVSFMAERWPRVKAIGEITAEHLSAYHEALPGLVGASRSVNVHLSVLRSTIRHAAPWSTAATWLKDCPNMAADSVHRVPFTSEQLQTVFTAAASDELLRPLVVCAACSAMRRKDVALLKWRSVDLLGGFITVKTAKTGESAEIPIFPMLIEELKAAIPGKRRPDSEAYVWPEAARLYHRSPDALDHRLKRILEAAGFVSPNRAKSVENLLPTMPEQQLLVRGLEAIESVQDWMPKRRDRTREVFRRYMAGETVKGIAAAMDASVGIVSIRLHDVEKLVGAQVIRRPPPPLLVQGTTTIEALDGHRKKRASLRGWHSFKTTWVSLALMAGIPMELVRRITGNRSVDVVLKHYFRPGREALKATVLQSMPRVLTASPGEQSPAVELAALAARLAAGTATESEKKRLRVLATKV